MESFLTLLVKYKDAFTIIGGAVAALVGGLFAVLKYVRPNNAPIAQTQKEAPPAAAAEPVHVRHRPPVPSQPAHGPNIVILDCRSVNIIFGEEYQAKEVSEGVAEAAIVLLRNDPVKGRRVTGMVDTRALLTIVPDVGKPVHIAAAQWLDSTLNCVDFNPGDTNRLIIALRSLKVDRLGTLDDRRELNGPEEVKAVELPAAMQTARVLVKLVGGFDSDMIEELEFILTREPFALRAA